MNIVGEVRQFLGGDHAVLKYSESRSSLSIDVVLVPARHRGQGVGGGLIARVLMLADITDRQVFVDARPIGSSGDIALERLVTYYGQFGFQPFDRGLTVVHMCRQPRADAQKLVPLIFQGDR